MPDFLFVMTMTKGRTTHVTTHQSFECCLEHRRRLFLERVKSEQPFTRVFYAQERAIRKFAARLENELERAPHRGFLQVDLLRKVCRLVRLRVQDDVRIRISRVQARHETELDLLGARKHRHRRPLCELVGIVLQFVCNHRTALGFNLKTPVDAGDLGIEFIQRLDERQQRLTLIHTLGFAHAIQLTTRDELRLFVNIPFAVFVRHGISVVLAEERHGFTKPVSRSVGAESLLAIRAIHACALSGELRNAINILWVVSDCFLRSFGHRK
mmetsp:Transcript_6827/g.24859  ORF Transcript_6827/g.24859 Transcript_6827/m.24859 type:complete len:269 (-) Transcript_6827:1166-1972(-)